LYHYEEIEFEYDGKDLHTARRTVIPDQLGTDTSGFGWTANPESCGDDMAVMRRTVITSDPVTEEVILLRSKVGDTATVNGSGIEIEHERLGSTRCGFVDGW
jgi:hypothetical protein